METAMPTKVRSPAMSSHAERPRLRSKSRAKPAIAAPAANSSVATTGAKASAGNRLRSAIVAISVPNSMPTSHSAVRSVDR
jgi:hypothetical protein